MIKQVNLALLAGVLLAGCSSQTMMSGSEKGDSLLAATTWKELEHI